MASQHGPDRRCWVSQGRAEKRPCIECLKGGAIADIPLVPLTSKTLEINHRDFTNSVCCDAGCAVHVIHAGTRPLGVAHAALPSAAKDPAGIGSSATASL